MGEDPHCVATKTIFNLNDLIRFNDLNNLSDLIITFPLAAQRQNVPET
jgi:hypothetical protein